MSIPLKHCWLCHGGRGYLTHDPVHRGFKHEHQSECIEHLRQQITELTEDLRKLKGRV